jgi:hypothetical protein
MQQFHANGRVGILQKSIQFHKINVGFRKKNPQLQRSHGNIHLTSSLYISFAVISLSISYIKLHVLLNYQKLLVARTPDHCRDQPYKPKVVELGLKFINQHLMLGLMSRCMRGSVYPLASVEVVYG